MSSEGDDYIVETKDLTKYYQMGKVTVKALDGVDLKVKRAEFLSVQGPSGCGKSTLLHLIGCLDRPTKGSILINGVEVTKAKDSELPRIRRDLIGFVFQQYNLLPTLSALENVELAMRFAHKSKQERIERAKEVLNLVGLADRLSHKPTELSGGEQQRVAIARALANNPAIILADEPTGELDSKNKREIAMLLKNLSEGGQTVIVVTHDPQIAELSRRNILMRDGKIVGERW